MVLDGSYTGGPSSVPTMANGNTIMTNGALAMANGPGSSSPSAVPVMANDLYTAGPSSTTTVYMP
jgi:hypothetical protein